MPVARYFLFVGGLLLALLFALDTYLPKPVGVSSAEADISAPKQRIRSDQKWPERIVMDTSLPTIVPVQTAAVAPEIAPVPKDVAIIPAKAAALDSFAQLSSSNEVTTKKPERPAPRKHKVAKRHVSPPPVMMVAQQPRFGLFANNFW